MESSWVNILDKFKIPIGLSLVGLVLIIGGLLAPNFSQHKSDSSFPKESLLKPEKDMTVDVSGAVLNPGVYKIATSDARIQNAINAAGGLATNSSQEYTSKYLNMAQKIADGMKIYIPKEGEQVTAGVASTGQVAGAATSQVNINTASQSELEALPGIGPVTAAKIIGSRPFQKIEDLSTQKVVSKATFEKIKNQIVVY